jgi:hypothetical protein
VFTVRLPPYNGLMLRVILLVIGAIILVSVIMAVIGALIKFALIAAVVVAGCMAFGFARRGRRASASRRYR